MHRKRREFSTKVLRKREREKRLRAHARAAKLFKEVDIKTQNRALDRAIDRADEALRYYVMRVTDRLSYKEIGRRCGVSEKTVQRRLTKFMKRKVGRHSDAWEYGGDDVLAVSPGASSSEVAQIVGTSKHAVRMKRRRLKTKHDYELWKVKNKHLMKHARPPASPTASNINNKERSKDGFGRRKQQRH